MSFCVFDMDEWRLKNSLGFISLWQLDYNANGVETYQDILLNKLEVNIFEILAQKRVNFLALDLNQRSSNYFLRNFRNNRDEKFFGALYNIRYCVGDKNLVLMNFLDRNGFGYSFYADFQENRLVIPRDISILKIHSKGIFNFF